MPEPATQVHSVKTTCPYCGVGCGVVASTRESDDVRISGDTAHPANKGRLCSKGAALGETLALDDRLLYPEVEGKRCSWGTAFNVVAQHFLRVIAEHGPDAVAFYVSGQLLTEDYYVANKLMKGFIGSANIDTNSRLCMASSVAGHKRAFGSDSVPGCYDDLEQAELIVLVGSNAAWCHPVLFQRATAAGREPSAPKIIVIDPRRTATCDGAALHLAVKPGTDAVLFNGLLQYLHAHGHAHSDYLQAHTEGVEPALQAARDSAEDAATVAEKCNLDMADVTRFFELFAQTEKVVTVYSQGINQSSSGTDKVNAIINCHLLTGRIGRPGMGPLSFTGQPNAMGGREVGGMANQLAAHMELENPVHRERVQRFWDAPRMAARPGLKAVDMFRAVGEGRIKAIWIMATNPVDSMPDADAVREALNRCELVVVSDCVRRTDTTALAHVLLPAQAWGEKDGTVTNSERRISRQRAFLPAPGEAKPDWWIISEVAKRLGYHEAFRYNHSADVFFEHAALSGFENNGERAFDISGLQFNTVSAYDALQPIQWPVVRTDDGKLQGTVRLFSDGRFTTPNKKARFIAVLPRPPQVATNDAFPLVLNTGRVRDHWHTLTRTGKSPRLSSHSYEPCAELHPDDAAALGVQHNALTRIASGRGEVVVRAVVTPTQQKGSVFVPLHWTDQFARQARIDTLVNPVVDPISGQPESKHTPVQVTPYRPAWHGFLLSRRELPVNDARYWVRARGQGLWRYELAGEQLPPDWSAWARDVLCMPRDHADDKVEWIDYLDSGAQRYRGARLLNRRIESCLFVAPTPELPSRSWLMGLFAQPDELSAQERSNLLAARATLAADTGPIVCACFSVGRNTLLQAIQNDGLHTVEALGTRLQAGTNCGSCIPELKALLAQTVKQYA